MADKFKGKTAREWAELAAALESENLGLIKQLDAIVPKQARLMEQALRDARVPEMRQVIVRQTTLEHATPGYYADYSLKRRELEHAETRVRIELEGYL